MGKQFLLALSFIVACGTAQAGYNCTSFDQSSTLILSEHNAHSVSGKVIKVVVTDANGSVTFKGEPPVESSPGEESTGQTPPFFKDGFLSLMNETKYSLEELVSHKVAQLTIVSKPKTCGRGLCDPDGALDYKAKFEFDGQSTQFFCDLTN